MACTKIHDVLIIGSGPAGLSAAVALARQAHTALILDSCAYRNATVKHMHNVPAWDHANPADFRNKILSDLAARYPCVERKVATIKEVRKRSSDLFEAVAEDGTQYQGRKLVLATGVRDRLEDEVPGYKACWGRGVFHCLFCHGYEERGAESVGVLVSGMFNTPEAVLHVARMAKRLSKTVTIYTHDSPALAAKIKELIHSSKICVSTRPIASLALIDEGPEVQITLADGSTAIEGFIASHPAVEQRAQHLVQQLGLETTPTGEIKVQAPWSETSVAGCFAVGDAATPMRSVVSAMCAGNFAGVGVAGQLQREMEERDEL
ncbi:hypothetical protein LTR09_007387 [Extremus antarcticus]|uniref:FAD/NAD(P)-binding domain-containing protein n=1 Tax=Extremus antarcticus TaxID=702011 RepID=A0AAJ0DJE4_9PEZI|nr:hypothetical protein LTR09_007387 [Extremus antarcticus]